MRSAGGQRDQDPREEAGLRDQERSGRHGQDDGEDKILGALEALQPTEKEGGVAREASYAQAGMGKQVRQSEAPRLPHPDFHCKNNLSRNRMSLGEP